MKSIFRVNEAELEWFDYEPGIRAVKALTRGHADVAATQYVEYGPGHTDPVHSHDTDEVFVVTDGELAIDGMDGTSGPGGIVLIRRDTEYAVRGLARREPATPHRRVISSVTVGGAVIRRMTTSAMSSRGMDFPMSARMMSPATRLGTPVDMASDSRPDRYRATRRRVAR